MNKQEALNRLKNIEEETKKLKLIIENNNYNIDDIKNLEDLISLLDLEDKEKLKLCIINPKTSFEKYLNACILIPLIVKIYNQNNILDWNNKNQYKYLPYYKKDVSGWVCYSCGGWSAYSFGSFGHHYYSEKIANKAIKKFNDIYLDFYTYKG